MKRIIAVATCHAYKYPEHDSGAAHTSRVDAERSAAIRKTWLKDWEKVKDQIDLKFFYGRGADRCPKSDEVFLDCGDDYYSLPDKIKKIFEWCMANGYEAVLKCDDDVFIFMDRLLKEFTPAHYRGFEVEAAIGKYASGTAYWIDRQAMQIVVNTKWHPAEWAEDKFVGSTLFRNGIELTHDERFQCCHCKDCLTRYPLENRISTHTTEPRQMEELWQTTSY